MVLGQCWVLQVILLVNRWKIFGFTALITQDVSPFRYIPTEEPSTTVFVMPGLEVLDKSTPTHIILNNAVSDTSGVFKCEVSAGPPRFSTASRTTQIQIVGKMIMFKLFSSIISEYFPHCTLAQHGRKDQIEIFSCRGFQWKIYFFTKLFYKTLV